MLPRSRPGKETDRREGRSPGWLSRLGTGLLRLPGGPEQQGRFGRVSMPIMRRPELPLARRVRLWQPVLARWIRRFTTIRPGGAARRILRDRGISPFVYRSAIRRHTPGDDQEGEWSPYPAEAAIPLPAWTRVEEWLDAGEAKPVEMRTGGKAIEPTSVPTRFVDIPRAAERASARPESLVSPASPTRKPPAPAAQVLATPPATLLRRAPAPHEGIIVGARAARRESALPAPRRAWPFRLVVPVAIAPLVQPRTIARREAGLEFVQARRLPKETEPAVKAPTVEGPAPAIELVRRTGEALTVEPSVAPLRQGVEQPAVTMRTVEAAPARAPEVEPRVESAPRPELVLRGSAPQILIKARQLGQARIASLRRTIARVYPIAAPMLGLDRQPATGVLSGISRPAGRIVRMVQVASEPDQPAAQVTPALEQERTLPQVLVPEGQVVRAVRGIPETGALPAIPEISQMAARIVRIVQRAPKPVQALAAMLDVRVPPLAVTVERGEIQAVRREKQRTDNVFIERPVAMEVEPQTGVEGQPAVRRTVRPGDQAEATREPVRAVRLPRGRVPQRLFRLLHGVTAEPGVTRSEEGIEVPAAMPETSMPARPSISPRAAPAQSRAEPEISPALPLQAVDRAAIPLAAAAMEREAGEAIRSKFELIRTRRGQLTLPGLEESTLERLPILRDLAAPVPASFLPRGGVPQIARRIPRQIQSLAVMLRLPERAMEALRRRSAEREQPTGETAAEVRLPTPAAITTTATTALTPEVQAAAVVPAYRMARGEPAAPAYRTARSMEPTGEQAPEAARERVKGTIERVGTRGAVEPAPVRAVRIEPQVRREQQPAAQGESTAARQAALSPVGQLPSRVPAAAAVPIQPHRDWPVMEFVHRLVTTVPAQGESAAAQVLRRLAPAQARPAFAALASLPSLGAGQPLASPVRRAMERMLGGEFSRIRTFVSPVATMLGAEAFTSGERVVFAPGRMDLHSPGGLSLLGHELTHIGVPLAFKQAAGVSPVSQDASEVAALRQEQTVRRIIEHGWPESRMELRRTPATTGVQAEGEVLASPASAPGLEGLNFIRGTAPGIDLQRAPVPGPTVTRERIQREGPTETPSEKSLDDLAREVYGILKTRLRAERDRYQFYPR